MLENGAAGRRVSAELIALTADVLGRSDLLMSDEDAFNDD
jgi:hypothetical protein